uniref:NADH-ubiquinone oxidoreductase chain 1 n=2 Tax=Aleurodicus TaxID=30098 RepID=Q6JCT5_ALEDU|nr:NADH dehydrogenase subunit 1 [Aleurodicus dugesii]AAS77754.1 NADH dehydrogenase subunit 1 [Aleurodicus dugesii]AAS77757.1 NADH dehydrogenase subunit 1 [Aleurodicus dispersus]
MIYFLIMILLLISTFLSIAFFTLMERKILSYMQNRKGPNKTLIMGILQPFSDAIKLFSKEMNLNFKSNYIIYYMFPLLNIICSLMMWMIYPFYWNFNFNKFNILMLMSMMSINMIIIMLISWSSNSNYAMIGLMRSIAQMISYEINLMIIIMTIVNLTEQLNFNYMFIMQKYMMFYLYLMFLFYIWIITILAETNRTPFDFSEGESELISGFNIEYSSFSFAFIFLAEYSNILIMSLITLTMFFNMKMSSMIFFFTFMILCFLFIWTRCTLPRFRYDKLMYLTWIKFLPLTILYFFFSLSFKLYYTKKNDKTKDYLKI